MKYWPVPPPHLLTKFMIVPKYLCSFALQWCFFLKLLYFWKQKNEKLILGGYLEIAYDPTVSAKTPIKVTRTLSLLANGKNITVSHQIFCKIKVDSQIENKLVACMRQVFVWPVDLHTVQFWLISFHLLTTESRINVPLRLSFFGIFPGRWSYCGLKFYYITLHILRGYIYVFFFSNFPEATFIQGATSIRESSKACFYSIEQSFLGYVLLWSNSVTKDVVIV